MAWYDALTARTADFRLATWDELPDLGLYMDQVITYLDRQYRPLYGEDRRIITAAMINNYVKSGLVSRPKAKKYDREQIAQLIMLCALKQILPLEALRGLIDSAERDGGVKAVYANFSGTLKAITGQIGGQLDALSPMQCAVQGAAYQLLSEEMLRYAQGDARSGEEDEER